MDTSGTITLSYIVSAVLNDMNNYGKEQRRRLLQFACEGVTELSMYTLPQFRTILLTMDANGRVYLPVDYMGYTRIGLEKAGKVYVLGQNNNISLSDLVSCGVTTNNALNNSSPQYLAPFWYNGRNYNTLYGNPGGWTESSYRVDDTNRFIQFDTTVKQDILLEYVSSGVKLDGETIIPRYALQVLKAWVHWKRKQQDNNFSANDKILAQQDYFREESKLGDFVRTSTIDEIRDIILQTNVAMKR